MYKLVEIGAATNFVADQLLKTKAGENVIALMSATVPVMSDEACIVLLSTLFECSGATLDNIPGRTQLENFRKALAPLARKTGFGERVYQYHYFLARLAPPDPSRRLEPYDAIPEAAQIPLIVKYMHQMVTTEAPYVLIVTGIRGAAWIVAYATYVLGWNACALDRGSKPVPITSSYAEARVIVQAYSSEYSCGLYLQGELQDIITIGGLSPSYKKGWIIDCGSVNFVDTYHPALNRRPEFLRISTFAAIELYNSIFAATSLFEQWTPDAVRYRVNVSAAGKRLSFKTYIKSVMEQLFERGLSILQLLGFRPATTGYVFDVGGENVLCLGHRTDPEELIKFVEVTNDECNGVQGQNCTIKTINRLGRFLQPDMGSMTKYPWNENGYPVTQFLEGMETGKETAHMERMSNYVSSREDNGEGFRKWSLETRRAISDSVKFAVHFASRLAFTDWHSSIRMLSLGTLTT